MPLEGLPIRLAPNSPPLTVRGETLVHVQYRVRGITAADALDALDAMGVKFSFQVPKAGIIYNATLLDPDKQSIETHLWLFRREIIGTASDAAFAPTDLEMSDVIGPPLDFTTWEITAGQALSYAASPPLPMAYYCPTGVIWGQFKTLGAYTVSAVGKEPVLQIEIVPI